MSWKVPTILVAIACVLAALVATAGPARGALLPTCGTTSQVFAPWSDISPYYLAPNGGFENGSTNWTVSGAASVVADNDAYKLSGAGSHALNLGTGATASTTVCYGLTYPALRFVASGVGGPATIHVRVVAHGLLGVLATLDGGRFTVNSGWQAAPKLSTLFAALTAPLGTNAMEVRISVESGTARIDDLYIDPFVSR